MYTNLSNVNQTAHEVLVAELGDSLLRLFSRGIFDNSYFEWLAAAANFSLRSVPKLTRIPTMVGRQRPKN